MTELSATAKHTYTGARFSLDWPLVCLLAMGCLWLALPGNIPFINDEPMIIDHVLRMNAAGKIIWLGLGGERAGVFYGPIPHWFYQLFLLASHDLIALVVVKTALIFALVLLSALGLARLSGLPRWPLILLLASPYLYFYARQLWDNVFLIPLSLVAVWMYALFVSKRSVPALYGLLAALSLAALTHLMSLKLALPLVGLLLLLEGPWLLAHWKRALPPFVLALAALSPYILYLARNLALQGPGAAKAVPLATRLADAGNILTFYSFPPFFTTFAPEIEAVVIPGLPLSGGLVHGLALGAFLLCLGTALAGLYLALRELWAARKDFRAMPLTAKLTLVCLGTWAMELVLHGYMPAAHAPHYFNATFFCGFYFLWRGLAFLGDGAGSMARGKQAAGGALVVASILLLLCFIGHIDALYGNRVLYHGPTLATRIDAIEQMRAYAKDSPKASNVPHVRHLPHSMSVLEDIYAAARVPGAPRRLLIVGYVEPSPSARLGLRADPLPSGN